MAPDDPKHGSADDALPDPRPESDGSSASTSPEKPDHREALDAEAAGQPEAIAPELRDDEGRGESMVGDTGGSGSDARAAEELGVPLEGLPEETVLETRKTEDTDRRAMTGTPDEVLENQAPVPGAATCGAGCRRGVLLAVLMILALGTVLRMQDFFQPWKNTNPSLVLKGFGGANYSTMARNHLRYGYEKTRLAMVNCGGQREVSELENHRYLNHPPLFAVLLSFSFHLFGVHEWSARLIPLLFSVASLIMLFVVCRMVAGVKAALIAMALMAVMPMAVYYGAFVEVQSFQVMFLSLVLFFFYWKWHTTRRAGHFLGMLFFFVLGAGFDWPIYLLAFGLFLHHLLAPGSRGRSKAMLVGLPVVVVLAFSATLAYVYLLSAERSLGGLLHALWVETTNLQDPRTLVQTGDWQLWPHQLSLYFPRMYTLPVMILTGVWILSALWGGLLRRAPAGSALVFGYLCMGAGYVLLFPTGSTIHEYWSMYLIPVFAVATALLLAELGPRTAWVATLVLAGYLGVQAWNRFEPRIPYDSSYYVQAGRALQEKTDPADKVAVLAIGTEEFFYAYYGDRTVYLPKLEQLAEAADPSWDGAWLKTLPGRWMAVPRDMETHPLRRLDAVYTQFQTVRKHLMDRLGAKGPPVEAGPLLLYRR